MIELKETVYFVLSAKYGDKGVLHEGAAYRVEDREVVIVETRDHGTVVLAKADRPHLYEQVMNSQMEIGPNENGSIKDQISARAAAGINEQE